MRRWFAASGLRGSSLRVVPRGPLPLPQKLALAVEIVCVYAATRWRLRRRNLSDLAEEIRAGAQAHRGDLDLDPGSREAAMVAARLGHATARAVRLLPTDSKCLVQSIVLSSLLSARGITGTLVIGAHSNPEFTAHAWVEYAGRPLLPAHDYQDSRLLEI
jgi:Transglutaminase-like superfamily